MTAWLKLGIPSYGSAMTTQEMRGRPIIGQYVRMDDQGAVGMRRLGRPPMTIELVKDGPESLRKEIYISTSLLVVLFTYVDRSTERGQWNKIWLKKKTCVLLGKQPHSALFNSDFQESSNHR